MMNHACPRCNAYLLNHQSAAGWKKCPTCGYCRKEKLMISLSELNPHSYPTSPEIDANLAILLDKINQIRTAWAKPMTVTSGLRSDAQQQALIAAGKSNAPKSHHLAGEAVDILDADHSLQQWCKENESLLESIGLWMEDFSATPNWCHFQIVAPKSGKRWFIP